MMVYLKVLCKQVLHKGKLLLPFPGQNGGFILLI